MQLTSSAFGDGQEMAQKYGKKIDNVSVPLTWEGAPKGTKSFALTMVDLDNHNYVHWMVTGIGADVSELIEGAASSGHLPTGAQQLKPYAGPFPPSGTHRYAITLYALNTDVLELPAKATFEMFASAMNKCCLATAALTGTFTKVRQ